MSIENRVRELVQANLGDDHHFAGVEFVDQLLQVVSEAGAIKCWQADNRKLCFQVGNQPVWEVELSRARTKLRMLCARLGVICQEQTGRFVNIFRDESSIEITNNILSGVQPVCCATKLTIRFKNTPSQQEFMIETDSQKDS